MTTRILAALALLLLAGCASTPHGKMFPATVQAPDTETGAGCERFGVRQTPGFRLVSSKPVFNPHFVEAWEIDQYCPTSGRGMVWGCYHPNGDAYIVGKDWQVYWHEWCHAKLGPAHTRGNQNHGDYVAPRSLLVNN